MLKIKTVTVIGANGTMGSSVAAIFASFGQAKVYLVSRTIEKSKEAIEVAVNSVRADSIRERLIAKTYQDLQECIENSDWVFESVAEDFNLKREINNKLDEYRKEGTIVSTGTSGLSVQELSKSFDTEGRRLYFGTHFYNPPYNLSLCELVSIEESNQEIQKELYNYLEKTLLRKVVLVQDKPAFLGNRIGFQFLNEAAQLSAKYSDQGGIDYIDAIFGPFTGRGMAPLVTVDFVGLDIHKAIVNNLINNTNDVSHNSFRIPGYLNCLIEKGRLGRKTGAGLYKTIKKENGEKVRLVYDITTGEYREKQKYSLCFAHKMVEAIKEGEYKKAIAVLKSDHSSEAKICQYLLYKYVLYSLIIAQDVASSDVDADVVMSYGFNWIPPLALLELLGGIKELIAGLKNNHLFEGKGLEQLKNLETKPSRIDYRKYLRARF